MNRSAFAGELFHNILADEDGEQDERTRFELWVAYFIFPQINYILWYLYNESKNVLIYNR